ncbi:hypothetical protein ACIRL2_45855 [Embleya sp. NPDC127516]|uniref:Lsr2 family DNA-binding protein n=1 Tax=Embleya sp. NPDC127516 TaxID=3363990 RepID=UPI00381B4B89
MIETLPEPTTTAPSAGAHGHPADVLDVDALLAWGAAQQSPAIRTLAERAGKALSDLAARRERQEAVHAAQRRLIDAELLLAQAQRDLRAAKIGTGATSTTTPPPLQAPGGDPGTAQRREEGRRARAWAAREGIACPDRGIVPKHVLEAYRRADPVAGAGE